MDLTKQPPRRPSNLGMAGVAGLARMTDKARGANDETEGEYKYGRVSGLDVEVLGLIGMSHEEFAEAADELDDAALSDLVAERIRDKQAEVSAFNNEQLNREPQDDLHRRLLKERLEKYAPGRTDISTVFASIELDDTGLFRDTDLTQRPPRTPYLRSVAGVMGLARMGDKARAYKAGLLGAYRYGSDSGLDQSILDLIGVDAEAFAAAAYENPNDSELGDWVHQHMDKTPAQISAFNAWRAAFGRHGDVHQRFLSRRAEMAPEPVSIETFFDLIDYDDEKSFGLVDLTRHAPRSGYDSSVGGVTGLARLIDKGRAHNGDTLGDYWYGEDSGLDRALLEFLGLSGDEFAQKLQQWDSDDAVVAGLGDQLQRLAGEIATFNEKYQTAGPANDRSWGFLRSVVAKNDPGRTELASFCAITALDDQISFARQKAGI
ncbi:MAG: DUF5069 domain-containing protein [Candidatus Latescibacteria bacterium]|nr:DUF5069 domain-containing protein [Candidatus Latescibacterota bacterium]